MPTAERLVPPTATEVLNGAAVLMDMEGSAQLKLRLMYLLLSQYFAGEPVDLPTERESEAS